MSTEKAAEVLRAHGAIISGDVDGWHVFCPTCGDVGLASGFDDVARHQAAHLAPLLREVAEATNTNRLAVWFHWDKAKAALQPRHVLALLDRLEAAEAEREFYRLRHVEESTQLGRIRALVDELEAAEVADLRDYHAADLRAVLDGEGEHF